MGFENLTFVPIDTRLLDYSIMTHKEKDWLNGYHAEVFEKIGPHVEGEVLEWLEKAVKSI